MEGQVPESDLVLYTGLGTSQHSSQLQGTPLSFPCCVICSPEKAPELPPEGWQPQCVFKRATSERPQPLSLEGTKATRGLCQVLLWEDILKKHQESPSFLVEENAPVLTLQ